MDNIVRAAGRGNRSVQVGVLRSSGSSRCDVDNIVKVVSCNSSVVSATGVSRCNAADFIVARGGNLASVRVAGGKGCISADAAKVRVAGPVDGEFEAVGDLRGIEFAEASSHKGVPLVCVCVG